jgi:hypothetical protein
MKKRVLAPVVSRGTMAVLLLPVVAWLFQTSGVASTPGVCADPTPYKWLQSTTRSQSINPENAAAMGADKAALDAANPAIQADLQEAARRSAPLAEKLQVLNAYAAKFTPSTQSIDQACGATGAKRGSLWQQYLNSLTISAHAIDGVTTGWDYANGGGPTAWLNGLNQQGQWNNYYCGPAAIAEETTTEGVAVDQGSAAAYMGTTTAGTDVTQMTQGMQHFVGNPVVGWSYYVFVWVPYSQTSSDHATFRSDVQYDIYYGMPVSGDAYEEYGFLPDGTPNPHLTGHPNQTIFHWFEIGGFDWAVSKIYYADSATSVWGSVPPFSWYDEATLLSILGGRGFLW